MTTTTKQAPALPALYVDVRKKQLTEPQKQPFAVPFLFWMYAEFLADVFERLPKKYHKEVDALLMMNTYVMRIDSGKPLTGMDVETLTEVLAQSTHLMKWE